MGRIKTQLIKRTGRKLYTTNKGKFTKSFDENKPIVQSLLHNPNKKLKNIVTGYITRLVKQEKF
jgi:ribosomal protein S17E